MAEQTSPEIESLGAVVAEYTPKRGYSKVNVITGYVVGVVGVALIIGGIVLMLQNQQWFCVPLAGVLAAVMGIVSYRMGVGQRGLLVVVYADGVSRTQGSKTAVFRWDEIDEVRRRMITSGRGRATGFIYQISDANGGEAKFDTNNLPRGRDLGQKIVLEVTRRQLPKAQAAYEKGETLDFGRFSLSKDGLISRKKTLAWSDVESVDLRGARIEVKEKGRRLNWASVGADQVVNYGLFLAMSKLILGREGQGAAAAPEAKGE